MKTLFILILSMLMTVSIFSQQDSNPMVDGFLFVDVNTVTESYAVEISITVDTDAALEEAAIKYKYNGNALLLDVVNSEVDFNGVENYDWSIVEGHVGQQKFADISILLNSGNGTTFSQTQTAIIIVKFAILDENESAEFCAHAIQFTGTVRNWSNGNWPCDNSALPVELTSFTANTVNNVVTLNWVTATELNNYGFDVERNGEVVGFVAGHGNSNSVKSYEFVDKPTSTGTYSYRLKQIDNDGSYEYSDAVETMIVVDGYTLSQNYPNPFNPSTTIKYDIKSAGDVTLKIYDVIGNEIAILVNEHQESGIYYMDFAASSLTSGVYIYRLSVGDISLVKKMTLLK